LLEEFHTYEALNWLVNNKNPSALASDRFGETINAINFVKKLYDNGAVEVNVINILDEEERIQEEGGPYATTLLVKFPKGNNKREKLLQIYKEEVEKHSLNEGEELDGWNNDILGFWWD